MRGDALEAGHSQSHRLRPFFQDLAHGVRVQGGRLDRPPRDHLAEHRPVLSAASGQPRFHSAHRAGRGFLALRNADLGPLPFWSILLLGSCRRMTSAVKVRRSRWTPTSSERRSAPTKPQQEEDPVAQVG